MLVVATASLPAPAALAQEATLRLLVADPLVVEPGAHTVLPLLVPRATADAPVTIQLMATAFDGGPVDGLGLTCPASRGAGTSRSPLQCTTTTPLLRIGTDAPPDPVTATIVATDVASGTTVSRVLSVEEAAPPSAAAPPKVEFTVESRDGVDRSSHDLQESFPVVDPPLVAIASGESDEAPIELSVVDGRPRLTIERVDAYGDLEASFDVNGPAAGGVLNVLVHHRRPWWVAALALLSGAIAASALALLQRRNQRNEVRQAYERDRSKGAARQAALLDVVRLVPGVDTLTVRRSFSLDQVVQPLTGRERDRADAVAAHGDDIGRYVDCCDSATQLLRAYEALAGRTPANALRNTIRDEVHTGPGADLAQRTRQLRAAAMTATEAADLYRRLEVEEATADQERRKALEGVRVAVGLMDDLTNRAPLQAGWGEYQRTQAAGGAGFEAADGAGGAVPSTGRGPLGAGDGTPPPVVVVRDRQTGAGRMLATKWAWGVALLAGLVVATVIDLGQTFGADEAWGTGWDMVAAFGRAFTVTGALQLARNFGATAGVTA